MSKKHKKNRNQNSTTPAETQPASEETKKTLKPVPKWKSDDGILLKLKRSDFPYNRAGIIAYCDFRIEYWKLKKVDMLKTTDPNIKLNKKAAKLRQALKEVEAQIASADDQQQTNS